MSYCSENRLPPGTKLADVNEFVELLDYKRNGTLAFDGIKLNCYFWFDDDEYRSWSGIELDSYVDAETKEVIVGTRTVISRSYFDLIHQNKTISAIRKRFGGQFSTDAGTGRYFRQEDNPPPPAASGCHLSFSRFGSNLIKAHHYINSLQFINEPKELAQPTDMSPRTLSNNMMISFLVSIMEDYLKSCFIALLKYSPSKEAFLRNIRLQGDQLARIANNEISVEAMVAETLSFQRVSAACKHFEAIDKKLDLAGALRRPFRRRQKSLFDLLEELVVTRHNFVHRAKLDSGYSAMSLIHIIHDIDVAMTRIDRAISNRYGWSTIERTWHIGRRPKGGST